jgi:hypothetical protein
MKPPLKPCNEASPEAVHPSNQTDISSILSSVCFIKGRMKLPLKPDGQWLRTVIKRKKK